MNARFALRRPTARQDLVELSPLRVGQNRPQLAIQLFVRRAHLREGLLQRGLYGSAMLGQDWLCFLVLLRRQPELAQVRRKAPIRARGRRRADQREYTRPRDGTGEEDAEDDYTGPKVEAAS